MPTAKTLTFKNNLRNDTDRRKRTTDRMVRIILVHRKSRSNQEGKTEAVKRIAEELKVSERTVFRDMLVLEKVYDQLGTTLFDHT